MNKVTTEPRKPTKASSGSIVQDGDSFYICTDESNLVNLATGRIWHDKQVDRVVTGPVTITPGD